MINQKKTYKLYGDIIITKGFSRSIMLDTTRNSYYFIPNDLYEIIDTDNPIDFKKIEVTTDRESLKVLEEYENFLIKNELIFEISENENMLFPKVSTEWESPYKISNIVIDIDVVTDLDYFKKIEAELENLGVESLQLRIFSSTRLLDIEESIFSFNSSLDNKLKDLQIEICNFKKEDVFLIKRIKKIAELPLISSINIYTEYFDFHLNHSKINFLNKKVINHKSCGVIEGNINSINKKIIHESKNFNSCLNCKTSIDSDGFIRNCPSMPQSFGNIKNTTLEEALNQQDFKKYWNITKDQIEVCKDCEFRYICTDCRAYKETPENDFSKPLKCGYNPYTSEWKKWEDDDIKIKAIKYYEMQEII
jgi:SPASM domain peptide maturase of grasp-with-spasm system